MGKQYYMVSINGSGSGGLLNATGSVFVFMHILCDVYFVLHSFGRRKKFTLKSS